MNNTGIMTEEQFDEIVKSNKPCLFDFSATWCGPCRMLAPVLEQLSEKHKGECNFYAIDVDSNEELAMKFGISAVPTVLVFNGGKEVARTAGYQDYDEIESFYKNALKAD